MLFRFVMLVFVAILVGGTAACGTDDNTGGVPPAAPAGCVSGSITGAGSTFAANIVQNWVKGYQFHCPDSSINYQANGSGAGIQQFIAGTVDFAGSDVPLTADELETARQSRGDVATIPWASGGIGIIYRLEGVENLRLSSETLVGIYSGEITRWDDPRLVADNPGADLPNLGIQAIHRSDGSGTTAALTQYFDATEPDIWPSGAAKDVRWPTGQGAKGSDGVTASVKAIEGAIGYAEVSYGVANGLPLASIRNASGNYADPLGGSVTAALDAATVEDNGVVNLDYRAPAANAYPIAAVTYGIFPANAAAPEKAQMLGSFARYTVDGGQRDAARLAYAPLSSRLTEAAFASIEEVEP